MHVINICYTYLCKNIVYIESDTDNSLIWLSMILLDLLGRMPYDNPHDLYEGYFLLQHMLNSPNY